MDNKELEEINFLLDQYAKQLEEYLNLSIVYDTDVDSNRFTIINNNRRIFQIRQMIRDLNDRIQENDTNVYLSRVINWKGLNSTEIVDYMLDHKVIRILNDYSPFLPVYNLNEISDQWELIKKTTIK